MGLRYRKKNGIAVEQAVQGRVQEGLAGSGLGWKGEELLERFILDLWNGLRVRIKMKVLRVWSFAKDPG